MRERERKSGNGIACIVVFTLLICVMIYALLQSIDSGSAAISIVLMGTIAILAFLFMGLYSVEPNQSAVLIFFGKYVGTVKSQGLRWNSPFYSKRKVSLRIRNFESGQLKVNELEGSPIEIASIIVWEVVDSAEAVFNVDDYESFVHIQAESALRTMASSYPYDQQSSDQPSLRSHSEQVLQSLQSQLQGRLKAAGVSVIEVRISHLAYAPEIAQAMLQRQQASAIIAARTRIVEGAVGMVEMALDSLKEKNIVDFEAHQRAAMVSNLMVVLCSDNATMPVINMGGNS